MDIASRLTADDVYVLLQYLADNGIITTKQKLSRDLDKSRCGIEYLVSKEKFRSVQVYKNATILINHNVYERVTGDTEPAESSEESVQ